MTKKHIPCLTEWLDGAPITWTSLQEVATLTHHKPLRRDSLTTGSYPFVSNSLSRTMSVSTCHTTGPVISITTLGNKAGTVHYWDTPVCLSDVYSVQVEGEQVLLRYIYHYLQYLLQKSSYKKLTVGIIPRLIFSHIQQLPFPLVPIEAQRKAVEYLDAFVALEDALAEEQQARHQAFETQLATTFGKQLQDAPRVSLTEVAEVIRGRMHKVERSANGRYPIASSDKDRTDVYDSEAPVISVGNAGGQIGAVRYWDTPVCFGNLHYGVKPTSDTLLPRFLYYALLNQSKALRPQDDTPRILPRLRHTDIAALTLPLPPLEEQERLTHLLHLMDTLAHSTTEGLPYQLRLQRQQYDYRLATLFTLPKR